MSTWDVKAGRVIYISYISHFVVRVQLADLNWWVVFNLSSCGLYLPLSATQPLSHRILTNKNRKRHIPSAYMNTSYGGGFAALWRYRDRSSQEYLTPGCQVLGGYEKLGTLPDMISSPGSHFAVLDHVKII